MISLKKIGCGLIGWNYDLLKSCSETSQQQYRKYLSAMIIMMILWGTIGFCFADRYLNLTSLIGKTGVALGFMFIIWSIERVVIASKGSTGMGIARLVMAFCMSLIGACIFDQVIFSNDMDLAIKNKREQLVVETVEVRQSVFKSTRMQTTNEKDSLENATKLLQEEYAKNPAKVIDTYTYQPVTTVDKDGNQKAVMMKTKSQTVIESPIKQEIESNQSKIKDLQLKLNNLDNDIKICDAQVRDEIMSRPVGFLEELNATISVISTSWATIGFYFLMLLFMLSLESFVLTIKHFDSKCDYEMVVRAMENQRQIVVNAKLQALTKTSEV